MSEVGRHATPRWRDVVIEQLWIVGLHLRPVALVTAAVLGLGTLLIVGEILSGGPGFDSGDTFPTALIAFLFPFAVWRGEERFGPAFLWTLPVDRQRLALTRVFAGWVWLMAGLAFFVCWLLVLGTIANAAPAVHLLRIPFIATMAMYLFGSAVVLGLRHPLRWLLGSAGVLLLMGGLSDVFTQPNDGEWAYVPGAASYFSTAGRAWAAWHTLPYLTQWTISTVVWIGAGLIALWLAASRHRECRHQ